MVKHGKTNNGWVTTNSIEGEDGFDLDPERQSQLRRKKNKDLSFAFIVRNRLLSLIPNQ